ncbi:MAG: helix-turn-helix transcriptional regulator [Clostridiaceae bacterium]|nr:helix-turn-helix transcriptional regulator [Clostridiaceae bacterium]
MNFSKRLKHLRKENNLTQEALAKKLNKSRSTIAGYETERKEPDYDTLIKIAQIFKVSIDYLLTYSPDVHSQYTSKTCIREKKTSYYLKDKGLPDEAIQQIEDYIEFIHQKYGKASK